jgi:HEAT repeat protein
LAALTVYSWMREPAGQATHPTKQAAKRPGYRPIRVSASALGVSVPDLVEQLLGARRLSDMRPIAEKLGAVAGDEVIEPLRPLLADSRTGVPDLVIDLYGKIGTDAAVAELIKLSKDHRYAIWSPAISALGAAGSERAESFLIELLVNRPTYEVIDALGKYPSTTAIAALVRGVSTVPEDLQRYVFEKLGDNPSPEAAAALRGLVDSASVVTATRAIGALDEFDDEMIAKLSTIVETGDGELGAAALYALSRAGEPGAPVIAKIALEGSSDIRTEAVRALGDVKSQVAFDALATLVEDGDRQISVYAMQSIAKLDMPGSRDLLISVAMSERDVATTAVTELAGMNGEDVDTALVEIAKSDAKVANSALGQLLTREHPKALEMVTARASAGTDDERMAAMELLSTNPSAAGIQRLIELVRDSDGKLKARALGLLSRRQEPAAAQLLTTALQSADPAQAAAAADALAQTGTTEARDALVAALRSSNPDVLYSTSRALENFRLDDASAEALARAAEANEAIAPNVMRKLLMTGNVHGTRLAEAGLESSNPDVALRTVESIRLVNSKAALGLLETAVHATEGEVRATAIRALGDTRDPRTVGALRTALEDSNRSVRDNVAYALRSVGGDEAQGVLIEMSRSSDPLDRTAALQGLRDAESRAALQRATELVRDPSSEVSYAAIRTLASSTQGAVNLRSIVLDGGAPQELRLEAATALRNWDQLDERTSEWLAQSQGNEYIVVE